MLKSSNSTVAFWLVILILCGFLIQGSWAWQFNKLCQQICFGFDCVRKKPTQKELCQKTHNNGMKCCSRFNDKYMSTTTPSPCADSKKEKWKKKQDGWYLNDACQMSCNLFSCFFEKKPEVEELCNQLNSRYFECCSHKYTTTKNVGDFLKGLLLSFHASSSNIVKDGQNEITTQTSVTKATTKTPETIQMPTTTQQPTTQIQTTSEQTTTTPTTTEQTTLTPTTTQDTTMQQIMNIEETKMTIVKVTTEAVPPSLIETTIPTSMQQILSTTATKAFDEGEQFVEPTPITIFEQNTLTSSDPNFTTTIESAKEEATDTSSLPPEVENPINEIQESTRKSKNQKTQKAPNGDAK